MLARRLSTTGAIAAVIAVAAFGQLAAPPPAEAIPVATDAATYQRYGRVFPDPQGCRKGQPGASPYAEGKVCSVDFIQFTEASSGLEFLSSIDPAAFQGMYPDGGRPFAEFMDVQKLDEDYRDVLALADGEGKSAGLPQNTGTREKHDLYMVKVTDANSDVPEPDRAHFVFSLSIHGIERAGAEGGIRAIEDLVTWGATDPDRPLVVTAPNRSVTIGEALRRSVIYFLLPNPDGWVRGDTTEGGPFYMRYNGNGIDLNRDWPSRGFTFRPYTPLSEPESRSYAKVLQSIKAKTTAKRFTGGNDLHGQLIDRAFSFTLIGGAERSFPKNEIATRAMRHIWSDQEARLLWSPLIKPNSAPRSCVEPGLDPNANPDPNCDKSGRVYADQWGTIWDTIDYTVTGALGDWIDQPLGLDGVGLDNEMSMSHLSNCGDGKCYDQQIEQLHVDGNKALIYTQVNLQLHEHNPVFRQPGRTAYVVNPQRVRNDGSDAPGNPELRNLPTQENLRGTITQPPNTPFEFVVQGPDEGVYNGGFNVKVTYSNVQGVSPGAVSGVVVERRNPEEPAPGGSEWERVNADYNQSAIYLQAGMTVNVNAPMPGEYRVRLTNPPPGAHTVDVEFTGELAWPDPGQLPYDVSNMDFLRDMDAVSLEGFGFTPITVADVLGDTRDLSAFDTIILVDDFMPGWQPGDAPKEFSDQQRDSYLSRLAEFTRGGGNLLLTDAAFRALSYFPKEDASGALFPATDEKRLVRRLRVYAGNVRFEDGEGPTYARYDLAKNVNQPGAAEGPDHRHQTAEPVPTGYAIQTPTGRTLQSHPNWIVDQAAWEEAGGVTVGRTSGQSAVGTGEEPNPSEAGPDQEFETALGVSLGELPYGDGVIRVLGGLLPMPTEEFDHPYGLSPHAVTYSGYEVFDNLLQWVRPGGTWRLAGANRYETAAEVADRFWNVVPAVVIATGETFADALTAAPLAKALDAPILLTPQAQLDPSVYEYLLSRNPAPQRAYVIGGEAAVSETVVEELERLRIPAAGIKRLSGADRYATNVEVAKELAAVTEQTPTKAVVATGERFPDALAAGPAAANAGPETAPVPLLLTQSDALPEPVAQYLEDTEVAETIVAGGPAAVSEAVVAALPSPTRVAGRERFETAVKLADLLAQLTGEQAEMATLATGFNFPDALVVGAPGGRLRIPTLLVHPDGLAASPATLEWLRARGEQLREVYIAGGRSVVPQEIAAQVESLTGR